MMDTNSFLPLKHALWKAAGRQRNAAAAAAVAATPSDPSTWTWENLTMGLADGDIVKLATFQRFAGEGFTWAEHAVNLLNVKEECRNVTPLKDKLVARDKEKLFRASDRYV